MSKFDEQWTRERNRWGSRLVCKRCGYRTISGTMNGERQAHARANRKIDEARRHMDEGCTTDQD